MYTSVQEDYAEFASHARLMTSIHAQARRPLTTSGGNSSANNSSVGAGSKGSEGGKQNAHASGGGGSPVQKRAKSEAGSVHGAGAGKAAPAASKAKKSLKRL